MNQYTPENFRSNTNMNNNTLKEASYNIIKQKNSIEQNKRVNEFSNSNTKNKGYKMKDSLKAATSNVFFNNNIMSNTNKKGKDVRSFENNLHTSTNPSKNLKEDFFESQTNFEHNMMKQANSIVSTMRTNQNNMGSQISKATNLTGFGKTPNKNNNYYDISSVNTPRDMGFDMTSNFNKNSINLEDIYIVQSNLFELVSLIYNNKIRDHIVEIDFMNSTNSTNNKIVQLLKQDINNVDILKKLCEEKFELITNLNIFGIEGYFDSPQIKEQIRIFFNLEMIYFVCLACYITENYTNNNILLEIGNIISNIYQSFLFVVLMITKRVSQDYTSNIFLMKLQTAISQRLTLKDIKNKENFILNQNNNLLLNMVKNFIGKYMVSKDLTELNRIVMLIIYNLKNYNNYYTRDIVLNMRSKVIYNFKEMRERELLNKPISIPFLKPLPPSEHDTAYTLVLDLDETLIHYSVILLIVIFLVYYFKIYKI
jgi:hypothetical protein